MLCEVFGIHRCDMGRPPFDLIITTAAPGLVRTNLRFDMIIEAGLETAADADLIAVPAHSPTRARRRCPRGIRTANARCAWVLSVRSGAFTLA